MLRFFVSDLCFPERYAKKVLALVDVDNSQVEQKNAPESFPTEKKHLKIVVVDESTAIRRIHDRILSEAGHKVVTAASGAEGLSFIRKAHAEFAYGNHDAGYDVILISHMMTGMSGPNAIQKMRQQLQGKPCIILGVTSETSPADITEMKASGADAIISKPLDMRKFKRALRGGHLTDILILFRFPEIYFPEIAVSWFSQLSCWDFFFHLIS